ncbi:MAG: FTR1 family protein [Verrucomicrobia bacterium]|nr:FTR1 family protein [Verrucomicrobiota bacterium]
MRQAELRFSILHGSGRINGFRAKKSSRIGILIFLCLTAVTVVAILIWQGVTANGVPDPTQPHTSKTVALLDIAVLVFREGLECILVLSAITASMVGNHHIHRRPVAAGAAVGLIATLITWVIAVGIVSNLAQSIPALDLQAATGLLAVIVLLVVMNWFFHKVYWGGWIGLHNRKKRDLLNKADDSGISERRLIFGLGLLGFASLYREGFEVVLFLQSYYLQMGGTIVMGGALVGVLLSGFVAVLTFVAHSRLPYRKLLVSTGVMLGFVLLIMVGEQAQEMQLANWIPTTRIGALENFIPGWMGMWFSVYPTVESLVAQVLAAILVIGSYYAARLRVVSPRRPRNGALI